MHSGLVGTSILHNLSLAIAYGGPLFAKTGLKKAVLQGISSDKERGQVIQIAWTEFNKLNVPAHLLFTGTWLVERSAIKRYFANRQTNKLVMAKDLAIGTALVSGVANVVAGEMMKRDFPNGVPYPSEGNVDPAEAAKIAKYTKFFRTVGRINRVAVAGSIALGPVIGASIFRHSSRGLLGRLLNK